MEKLISILRDGIKSAQEESLKASNNALILQGKAEAFREVLHVAFELNKVEEQPEEDNDAEVQ